MAIIRPLLRFCPYTNRFLTVEGVYLTKYARHASAISCMKSTGSNTQTSFATFAKEHWFKNRNFHQAQVNLDSKQSNEKIRDGKESKEDAKIIIEKPLTQGQRLRKVFAEYGSIGVAFHISISLTSLGICYCAVKR